MLDCMDYFLELLELIELDLSLDVSILISIDTVVERILELFWEFVEKENNIFTKFLLDTIIQDGGIRGRSNNLLNFMA